MTPDIQAKIFLYETGHFSNPAMKAANNIRKTDLDVLSMRDVETEEALLSLQSADANYEDCCKAVHASSSEPDGEYGPATARLMAMDRCSVPDFAIIGEEKLGGGFFPIPGCDPTDPEQETVASVRVYVDTGGASEKQLEYIEWCKLAAQHCSAEFGLRVRYVDNIEEAELSIAFKPIRGSTIGYFYLPQEQTCHQRLSGYLDSGFNPDPYMFALLLIHEALGHGIGHQHTIDGVMNPSLRRTPKSKLGYPTWNDGSRGNQAANRMTEWFGGKPISITPGDEPEPPSFSVQIRGTLEAFVGPASIGEFKVVPK